MGWVDSQLIDPILHFHYFGFDWIQPLPGQSMYLIFALLILSAVGIMAGFFYRLSSILFFLCFTYVELIDITYYLNHYYFVSIVAFFMILVPANRYFSLDTFFGKRQALEAVGRWCILIFKVQIAIVYIYAGLAKINYDWLFNALPLSIWLPAKTSVPVIGFLFEYEVTAYIFSWAGMLFDTFIIAGLIWKRTRLLAYIAVVVFHTITGILFQIGIFPIVMILGVTIFFSDKWHEKLISRIAAILAVRLNVKDKKLIDGRQTAVSAKWVIGFFALFFLFQVLFPWRYLLYPGNIFWTEEGYRFAWRVMLMEKAGTATFYVRDGKEGREGSVINRQFLNDHQEKQMAMQPDLILQFAHYLERHFKEQGMSDPFVRAEVWVTLNARPAKLLVDPQVDLTKVSDSWKAKDWILPYERGDKS